MSLTEQCRFVKQLVEACAVNVQRPSNHEALCYISSDMIQNHWLTETSSKAVEMLRSSIDSVTLQLMLTVNREKNDLTFIHDHNHHSQSHFYKYLTGIWWCRSFFRSAAGSVLVVGSCSPTRGRP